MEPSERSECKLVPGEESRGEQRRIRQNRRGLTQHAGFIGGNDINQQAGKRVHLGKNAQKCGAGLFVAPKKNRL